MLNYYTYIYLDPRKPGTYQYGDYTFDFEPFYVGKGKGLQCISHLREATNYENLPEKCWNPYKFYKIKKILKESFEPIILKVKENISEPEAFELEIYLIWSIGKRGIGSLTNLTNGGDGASGLSLKGEQNGMYGKHHSEETKEILRKWNKENPHPEEPKKKMIHFGENNGMYNRKHSVESREKMSKKLKGLPAWNKGKPMSEDSKLKLKESLRKRKILKIYSEKLNKCQLQL